MTRHVLIWKLKENYTPEEKAEIKATAREKLEGLAGKIPGLLTIRVIADPLPSSTGDLLLYTEFTDEAALEGYQKNPLHLAAAGYVRERVASRECADFTLAD